LIWYSQEATPEKQKLIQVEAEHRILRIPVFNFAALPPPNEKEKVSVFNERKGKVVKAYLRKLEEDPLGPTGSLAVLEVPVKSLEVFKKSKGPWQVYPPLDEKINQKHKGIYEINF
tara:strand:+ start:279 stop:626 length:348 start_codon:yes stop_codon:yes gene_type:complete